MSSRLRMLVAALAVLNGLVLVNALLHDPKRGYDARDHLRYIDTLAKGELPARADTREFFSPPAPYLVPALLRAAGLDRMHAAKAAQLFNALLSVGLCFYLVGIARRTRPASEVYPATAVALLALFPVYYKSFAQVRGEPLVAFCAVAIVYHAIPILSGARDDWRARVLLGGLCGLALLARQWGVFVVAALGVSVLVLALRHPMRRLDLARSLATVLAVALVVSGWFYLTLYIEYGSVAAFNRPGSLLSVSDKPVSFYFGIGSEELFTSPVRHALKNKALGIFYTEVWGDYWSYFSARDSGYLGRVNLASLFPTAFFLVATVFGLALAVREPEARSLIAFVIVLSCVGYGWFLVSYPTTDGDTVKATYLLHVFPFVALFGAELLHRLRERFPRGYIAVVVTLAAAFVHNLGAAITTY